MIIPAKKLLIVTLRDREVQVLRRLGELGIVQLRKLSDEDALKFKSMEVEKLRELEAVTNRFLELCRALSGGIFGEETAIYEKYLRLRDKLDELQAKRSILEERRKFLEALSRMGENDVPEVGNSAELFSMLGVLPKDKFRELEKGVVGRLIAVKYADLPESRVLVYLTGLIEQRGDVEEMLEALGFEEIKLPEDLPRNCQEAMRAIDDEAAKIENEMKLVRKDLEALEAQLTGFIEEDWSSLGRLKRLYEEVVKARDLLQPHQGRLEEVVELDEKYIKELIDSFYSEYISLRDKYHGLKSEEESLKKLKSILEMLRSSVDELPEMGDFELLSAFMGIVRDKSAINDFTRFISGKLAALQLHDLGDLGALLYIICLKDDVGEIRSRLKTIGFEELDSLSTLPRRIEDASAHVDRRIEEVRDELKVIEMKLEELRRNFASKFMAVSSYLEARLKVGEALTWTLRSESMRVIQGWILVDQVEAVKMELEKLRRQIGGALYFEVADPGPDEEAPTALKNPKPFKAFESLVAQYGWPGRREIDPTVVSGILWTTMFGLMFPDLGHGISIIVMGLFFSRIFKKRILGINAEKLGNLMIGLGISSAIFGLLLGEFFLIEFDPLIPGVRRGWIEDPGAVIWLIKVAIFFGIIQILLALVLAFWRELKLGAIPEAIMGQHGLAAIITFMGFVLTAFHFVGIAVIPGILEFPELGIGSLTQWPFFVMVAGIAMMVLKPVIVKESVSEGLGGTLETLTSFLANTFSYARIAGFAAIHAALAIFVHKVIEVDLALGIGMGLVFLNLFALTIELMVCMIQALRLIYYEFFTKFYEGSGSPYRPWRI